MFEMIGMRYIDQFELPETGLSRNRGYRTDIIRVFSQRKSKLLDFSERHIATPVKGHVSEHARKRTHQIKNGDDVAGHRFWSDMLDLRNDEQQQAHRGEEQ